MDTVDHSSPALLVIILIIGLGWLLPFIIIAVSRRTSGKEKLLWLLAVAFVSWFAWILYLLIAPITKNK